MYDTPDTRLWRASAYVVGHTEHTYVIELPGWDGEGAIMVWAEDIPEEADLKVGEFLYLHANIGCDYVSDLVLSFEGKSPSNVVRPIDPSDYTVHVWYND